MLPAASGTQLIGHRLLPAASAGGLAALLLLLLLLATIQPYLARRPSIFV
jgi:hypothetical protein